MFIAKQNLKVIEPPSRKTHAALQEQLRHKSRVPHSTRPDRGHHQNWLLGTCRVPLHFPLIRLLFPRQQKATCRAVTFTLSSPPLSPHFTHPLLSLSLSIPLWLLRWPPSWNLALHVSRVCFDCFYALPAYRSLTAGISSPLFISFPLLFHSVLRELHSCRRRRLDARMPRGPVGRSRLKCDFECGRFGLRLGRFLGLARPVWVSVQFSRSPRLAAFSFSVLRFLVSPFSVVLPCPFRLVYMWLPGPC